MRVLYNDNDEFAAEWIRQLIAAGKIPEGDVCDRGIETLTHCPPTTHLFAGIGGWALALRLAGWNPNRPVWTCSCPCQPYSLAGAGAGDDDDRNLWPESFRLVRLNVPDVLFGEQVESAIGHGWLDGIFADLEGEGYACGAAVLPAAGVGAPHIRSRIFWVAQRRRWGGACRGVSDSKLHGTWQGEQGEQGEEGSGRRRSANDGGDDRWLSNAPSGGQSIERRTGGERNGGHTDIGGTGGGLSNAERAPRRPQHEQDARGRQTSGTANRAMPVENRNGNGRVCDSLQSGLEGHAGHENDGDQPGRIKSQTAGSTSAAGDIADVWGDFNLIPCTDGKTRRLKPGLVPLVNGVPGRVGKLRGYGNAIVPQVAAEFIRAFLEMEREA